MFVTATGTDVGKTYAAALILKELKRRGLNAGYYKAALSGAKPPSSAVEDDDAYVCRVAGLTSNEAVVSYRYRTAVSPCLAAEREGLQPPDKDRIRSDFFRMANRFDYTVVEGSGGILCPLNHCREGVFTIADMVAEQAELESAAEAARSLKERIAGLEGLIGEVPGTGVPEWRALSDVLVAVDAQFDALKTSLSPEEAERIAGQIQRAKEQLALSAEEPATEWDALAEEAQAQAERAGELELMAKQAADEGKLNLEKAYLEEAGRLRDAAREKEKQAAEMAAAADAELWHNRISTAAGYVNDLVGTVSEACDLMSDTQDNLLSARLAELETAYLKGEMDEEEYNRKVSQAKKDAAQEQYKIQMWQWSAGIAQVLANTAVGISEAVKLGPVGIVSGALVAAAGAVQLASAIAAKPIPPSFATGGIVGGNSYHGDRVQANLNSREMVLNMGQQKNLFDAINAGSIGGGAVNVVVNNSASNVVTAEPVITKDRIEIMIDARVNASLRAGRYDSALTAQERARNGNFYGI